MNDLHYVLNKCEELHSQLVDLNTFVAERVYHTDGEIYEKANKRITKMINKLSKIETDFKFEIDPEFWKKGEC